VEKATLGGMLGKRKPAQGVKKSLMTPEERKESNARINKARIGKKYKEEAKNKMSVSHKNSIKSQENIRARNTKEWMDPNHPELGIRTVSGLVRMQRKRGLPSGPNARVKVGTEQ
jgi:hypothetical protein